MGSNKKSFNIEAFIMGSIIALIILTGSYYVFSTESMVPPESGSNRSSKDYGEGSLHHVADSLIQYERNFKFKSNLKQSWGIEVDENIGLYVCGDGGIELYDFNGNKIKDIATTGSYRFVIKNSQGKLMACKGNEIHVYDSNGQFEKSIKNSNWMALNAIFEKDGFLYIADRAARIIWKANLKGEILDNMGSSHSSGTHNLIIPGPYMDLSYSKEDNLLYCSNPGRHNVNAYSLDGELKKSFGKPSFKHTGFCGCCNPVSIHNLKDGHILTSEKGIARVKILNRSGDFVGILAAPKDFKNNKHSFIVDMDEDKNGHVYLLNNTTNEIYRYSKKVGS